MFQNYMRIAVRNFRKQPGFFFINLFGLTAGLTCFLLISLYLFDELTYDGFHKEANSIYRVVETKTTTEGKQKQIVSVPANVATARQTIPGVIAATRFSMLGRTNVSDEAHLKTFYESYYLADSSFFHIFTFPVVDGQPVQALDKPHTVVVSEAMALKLFGTGRVAGKTLLTDMDSLPYLITAVVKIPANSHVQFACLFSEATLNGNEGFRNFMTTDWSSNTFVTYFKMNADPKRASASLSNLVYSNLKEKPATKSIFWLQPLKKVHFESAGFEGQIDRPGNMMHIYVFGMVALFVLLIACINYINLTTAKFAGRSKEIAVRKVAGASRGALMGQFLSEASLITLCSLVLAIIAVEFILPSFNAFTNKELSLGFHTDARIWLGVLATTIIAGLAAGLYPALFQSGFRPYQLLKQKIAPHSALSLRKSLVVFQFSLSIIMIVATIVVYRQLNYVDTADMGFNKQQLLVVDINSGTVRRHADAIKTAFAAIPSVQSVSVSSRVPGEWKVIPKVKVQVPGRMTTAGEDVFFMSIDDHFLETFKIRLLKGKNFTPGKADSSSIILNSSAAAMLGVTEPGDQMIEIPSVAFSGNAQSLGEPFRARVIGIVADFNFQSMRDKVGPMILGSVYNPIHNIDYFTAKVNAADMGAVLKQMETVLHDTDPTHLFEYNFLDKQWDLFYHEDEQRETIFLAVALITILIASLGLLGLATYAAQQRIKEIGIRKVLGASAAGITAMLSKDFARLVLISCAIAFPISAWCMHQWLEGFAYRSTLSWWIFLVAGGLALAIALVTVSVQTVRAALSNPVTNLRSE